MPTLAGSGHDGRVPAPVPAPVPNSVPDTVPNSVPNSVPAHSLAPEAVSAPIPVLLPDPGTGTRPDGVPGPPSDGVAALGRLTPPGARAPFPGTENLNAAEVFGTPGYQAPRARTSPLAVAALVAGLASAIPGVGLVAVLLGTVGVRRLRYRYGSAVSLCWFGIVSGGASVVFYLWVAFTFLAAEA